MRPLPPLRPLAWLVSCVFAPAATLAQLLPNGGAPAEQRPVLLRTANGLPQVDITRPTAAGVSVNQFLRFDVDPHGAILNNGRKASPTALAGWVAGNPALAAGEARVIVNEVRSLDPSLLRGYIEIAGGKAELILANPAGIHCDGCGFIHASRVELATAKPRLDGGALSGYGDGTGSLQISGQGLDATGIDALSLMTRAARINAGIWAKAISTTLLPTATEPAPESSPTSALQTVFALDVAAIGGMYANRIWLVGTADGLGARNAGTWSAAESLTVSLDGKLENTGVIDARQLRIEATGIDNLAQGRLLGERIALQADRIANAGHPDARPVIAATGDVDIAARLIENTDRALMFSGADLRIGRMLDAQGRASGKAEQLLNRDADIESIGKLRIETASLHNQNAGVTTEEILVRQTRDVRYLQPTGSSQKYPIDHFYWTSWSRAGQYKWVTDPQQLERGIPGQTPLPEVDGIDCTSDDDNAQCTPTSGRAYPREDPAWAYFKLPPPDLPPPAPGEPPQPPAGTRPVSPDPAGNPSESERLAWAQAVADYDADLARYQQALEQHQEASRSYLTWQDSTAQRRAALNQAIDSYNTGFNQVNIRSWTQYVVDRNEYETRVVSSAPARIMAGADLILMGDQLLNDRSQIIAGGTLDGSLQNLRSVDALGSTRVQESGTSQFSRSAYRGVIRNYHSRVWGPVLPYAPADEIRTQSLPVTQTRDRQADRMPAPAIDAAAARIAADGSSLFRANPGPGPLLVTDPRFTLYRQWLSSDQMLAQLTADPERLQKRLGDGYIEQRLVREQIAELTGRRFLPGHTEDEAQFAALIAGGLYHAQRLQLQPGIALTDAQAAQLTADIVWLIEQPVLMPAGDGQLARTERVLVPRVYLRVRDYDLTGDGTLISAGRVALSVSGALDNAGTLAGQADVRLNAGSIRNSGTIIGDTATLSASDDLEMPGGRLTTQHDQWLVAGHDIRLSGTTSDSQRHIKTARASSAATRTGLDQVALLHVGGQGQLNLLAGRDIALDGAHLRNDGRSDTLVVAGRDLTLGTLHIQRSVAAQAQTSANLLREARSAEVGSDIRGTGGIMLAAGQQLDARAARVESTQGGVTLSAGQDLTITAGQSEQSFAQGAQFRQRGFLNSGTSTRHTSTVQEQAVTGSISAATITATAGQHFQIRASDIVAEGEVRLRAGKDLSLGAATENSHSTAYQHETRSGLLSGPGLSIGIGSRRKQTEQATHQTRLRGTQLGSLGGDVRLQADGDFRQEASRVLAPVGSVDIAASNAQITGGTEQIASTQSSSFSQNGLSIGVANPVLDTARSLEHLGEAVRDTSSHGTRAIAAAAAGLGVANAARDIAKDPAHAGGVTLALSLGRSNAQASSTDTSTQVLPSVVAGGQQVSIGAAGKPDARLSITGSELKAGDTLTLTTDGSLALAAQANTARLAQSHRSSSAGIGLAAHFGKEGTGIGIVGNAGSAQGTASGEDTRWTPTDMAAGQAVVIEVEADASLRGAAVRAPQVIAHIGGDLNMASPQDSSHYQSDQTSVSGTITVPVGSAGKFSGQVNASKARIRSDYQSTAEVTGIQAGDQGFDMQVSGNLKLDGAVIASTDKAVADGKNHLSSKRVTTTDLKNHADYTATGAGVGIGTGRTAQASYAPTASNAGTAKDSAHQASVTAAGISGIAGNTGVRTGDASTGLHKIFDAERVAKEINATVAISQEFSGQAYKVVDDYVSQNRRILQLVLAESHDEETKQALNAQLDQLRREEQALNILIGAVAGVGGTAVTKESLSSAAEKMRSLMIEESEKFKGITDGKTHLSNNSGISHGVRNDGKKLGGTRIDLDLLCGIENERCKVLSNEVDKPILDSNGKTQLILDGKGRVQFDEKKSGISLEAFLASAKGREMHGPTGGIQGYQGTLLGIPYEPGSWQDKLIEAFAGTHDYLGGKRSGLYDNQGNIKREMSPSERDAFDRGSIFALLPSAPFAISEFLPPAVWSAISIILTNAK